MAKLTKKTKGFYAIIGRKGGNATLKRMGKKHYKKIVRSALVARARNRRNAQAESGSQKPVRQR